MQLFKSSVVVLIFITIRCRAEILIAAPSLDKTTSSLVEDLVKILTSCYGDHLYGVGLAGNISDTLSRTLSVQHLIPVVLIDDTKAMDETGSFEDVTTWQERAVARIRFQYKLWIFILEASTWEQLEHKILSNLVVTIWNNPMASYFIIDRSPGCVNAQDFLLAGWKFKILNVKVMCYHHKSERIIVTFNPFTDRAPLPWQRDFKDRNSSFVSFSQTYGEHKELCRNLDFDKTEDLGHSEMIIEGRSPDAYAREAFSLCEYQLWSETDRVMTTIFCALNVTPVFTGRDRWDMYLEDVEFRIYLRPLFNETQYRFTTYPREQTEKVIVSHKARESPPNIIRPGIDINSGFGLGIVYSITPFFFRLFIQQSLVAAFLNLIRITFNMDFTNLPHNYASRIYVTSLLLFTVMVQGMYQGYFACMLTTRIPRHNIETMSDVAELGYKVYIDYDDMLKIKEPEVRKQFVAVYNPFECIKYTKRDSMAVCLWERTPALLDLAQSFDLDVSSKSVTSTYVAFEIHNESPFEDRLNVIIGKLAEADLLRHRYLSSSMRLADFRLTNSESNRYRKNNNFEKINLRELSFAFVILSIGLACATITFIAELAIEYKCRIVRR